MRKKLDLPERICDCGCARTFKSVRGNQRFFEPACRKKFHAEEMVAVRRITIAKVIGFFFKNRMCTGEQQLVYDELRAVLEKK